MNSGWEMFKCHYFGDVVKKELTSFLSSHGYGAPVESPTGELLFYRGDQFIKVNYGEIEHAPKYSLSVVLGIEQSFEDKGPARSIVPLWYLVTDLAPKDFAESCWFASAHELAELIQIVTRSAIEKYVFPITKDRGLLEAKILKFHEYVLAMDTASDYLTPE